MYLTLKKIKFSFKFFLTIIFFIYLLLNFNKTNLIFAGKFYSKMEKTDSSEKIFNSSEKKIEILEYQIDNLSKQKNLISQEIKDNLENLLFHLEIQSEKNPNVSERNSIFLKFQIEFLKKNQSDLKKKLCKISLDQIDLKIKLRKILYSCKN
ncbi:effector protein ['Fragaria x ananassa' phyllody phytoplasma]|uniref:Effector protein n=2 Tax='Fragaria x ananassa' phyllody phytoplasma TaxID=2358428 RepID=A0ABS5K466_9MOLU|nr:effector protein ['Fragaria x ananassa' phyllody phytoplasma]